MKKFIRILIILLLLILVILLYIYIPFIQGKHIQAIKDDTEIETSEWFQNRVQKYEIIRCQFGIKKMKYAFAYENKFESLIDYHIFFFDITKNSLFKNTVNSKYTGGTTIQNTTFPELVKMVKEDCSQFQGGFVNEDPNGIHWTYTRAETKEEKAKEIREKFDRNYSLTPFKDVYGDYDEMTDEELIELQKKIDEEGLDEKVENIAEIRKTKERLYKLTDKRKHQIIERYGDWKDLEDMDLVRYLRKIDEDFVSGKFRPEE